LKVATYYLSGWHIKPKGVKKPYVHHTVSKLTTDTTLSSVNSLDVPTTTRMGPRVYTSLNKSLIILYVHSTDRR
jgi:hypothetical protein